MGIGKRGKNSVCVSYRNQGTHKILSSAANAFSLVPTSENGIVLPLKEDNVRAHTEFEDVKLKRYNAPSDKLTFVLRQLIRPWVSCQNPDQEPQLMEYLLQRPQDVQRLPMDDPSELRQYIMEVSKSADFRNIIQAITPKELSLAWPDHREDLMRRKLKSLRNISCKFEI